MAVTPRVYTVTEIAEILQTKVNHVHAMLRRGEIRGIQIGNRGQWRIERTELDRYIDSRYKVADAERAAQQAQAAEAETEAETEAESEPVTGPEDGA